MKTKLLVLSVLFTQVSFADLVNFPGEIIRQRMEIMQKQAKAQCGIELTDEELKRNLVPVVMGCKNPEGVELILEDEGLSCNLRC